MRSKRRPSSPPNRTSMPQLHSHRMQAVCFQSFASVTAMAVNVAVEGSLVQRTGAAATVGRVTTLSEFDPAPQVTARDGHTAPRGAERGTAPPGAERGTMAPGAERGTA